MFNNKLFFEIQNKNALREKYNISQDEYLIGSFQRDTEGVDLTSPKLSKGPDQFIEMIKKYDHVKARESLEYFLNMTEMKEDYFDRIADKFRDPRVWWIENGVWWKDDIWGGCSSYGKVHLTLKEQERYFLKS